MRPNKLPEPWRYLALRFGGNEGVARLFCVSSRTIQRWANKTHPVDPLAQRLLDMIMADESFSGILDQCEEFFTPKEDQSDELRARIATLEGVLGEIRTEVLECKNRDTEAFLRMSLSRSIAWGIARHNQTHGWILDRIKDVNS